MSNIIKIEDVENTPNKRLQVDFEDFINEINTIAPIKATLEVSSLGEFVKITGNVKGRVILECDLCLNEFEYNLDLDIEELFAKNTLLDEYGQETELKEGQFITDLAGKDSIDIYDLLYQSVILDFPNKKVCGIKCKGDDFLSEENFAQNQVDPRLAVFKTIQVKKEDNVDKK